MNHLLKKLFEEIRDGSADLQNDAIGKLVEILRKNYHQGREDYPYVFLKTSEPLHDLTLTLDDKAEIIDEIGLLIGSETGPSPKRAALFFSLGSAYEWQSFELLAKKLQDINSSMSSEEFYQALISFDNLLILGRENKPKLHSICKTYALRKIITLHSIHKRDDLAALAFSILRQIDQLEKNP